MSVNSTGVPLFAGVEDIDDMFITTMEEMDKEVGDEISIPHPAWVYLKENNLIEYRDSIGTHVPVKLMDKENSTVKDFSHYDDVDNTPQDVLSEAKFAYGHIVGTQMYSREELVKNSGPEQLIDLVEQKQEQLEISMQNHFGTRLMGSQDADGRSFMGLGRVMAYDQSCGGITPTTTGFGYWNPQRGLKSGGGSYALATEFRVGFRRLVRLCTYKKNTPDVFICGEDLYDEFQAYAEGKLQLRLDELKSQKGWGDFNMFPLNGQTIIYDEAMSAKTGWLFNFKKYVKVRIHSGTNFQFEPWQMMNTKVAKKRDCLTYASIYVKRRNANGYITYT
jgi:hypothetical protein